MKVVTSKKMVEIENKAYKAGASEEDFMEDAGSGIADIVAEQMDMQLIEGRICLLCGKGNNGGDLYVAGRYLLDMGFEIYAYQVGAIEEASELCRKNHKLFVEEGGQVIPVETGAELNFTLDGLIVDGLFGTGFKGYPKEPFATVIEKANHSQLPIISVDIPSGLDGETGEVEGEVIKANATIYLGLSKTGFFLRDGWQHVGKLYFVDFGLSNEFIDESDADLNMLTADMLRHLMPPISRTRHKYQAGVVVGLAGSPGMPGAAMLASDAALHAGAGMVKLLHQEGMQIELAGSPYELIRISYDPTEFDRILELLNEGNASFIGPGMGRSKETRTLLKNLLQKINRPCVIDGDALSIIAEENLSFPAQSIITPHYGEMSRLLGEPIGTPITPEVLDKCQKYAEKHNVTLVLKGAPTFIFHPGETITVNPTGDPGMATAGSGDVLTGLIASLLAQGVPRRHAASLGVYLHGLAGEHAAIEKTSYCVVASDLIDYFPEAFQFIDA